MGNSIPRNFDFSLLCTGTCYCSTSYSCIIEVLKKINLDFIDTGIEFWAITIV